jgi:hypothetical protein
MAFNDDLYTYFENKGTIEKLRQENTYLEQQIIDRLFGDSRFQKYVRVDWAKLRRDMENGAL